MDIREIYFCWPFLYIRVQFQVVKGDQEYIVQTVAAYYFYSLGFLHC